MEQFHRHHKIKESKEGVCVVYRGLIIKETVTDELLLDLLTIEKVEIWKTDNVIKYWTMIWFSSNVPDFPDKLSKVMIGGYWFADLISDKIKFIVFKDTVLKYTIGNAVEKEFVLNECRKRGVPNHQLTWDE